MKKEKQNIIFIEGLEPRDTTLTTSVGYLFALGCILELNGLNFKVLHVPSLKKYSTEGIIEELSVYDFDAIGMTTNADNIRFVYRVSNALKKAFPEKKIILGGPQVTYSDERTLRECLCDIVIRHEGELKLLEVLKSLERDGDLRRVDGITYKKDNEIIRNKDSQPLDLDELPVPKFEILTNAKYWIIPSGVTVEEFNYILNDVKNKFTFFMTGRGCPYSCAFCVEGNSKNKYRFRSPAKVKLDLNHFLFVTKSNSVIIGDDTFTSSLKRVKDLCAIFKEIQKEYPFTWFCEGRVDVLSRHPEMISIMYEAGLRKLQIGIESGNQKVLDIYNKNITLEQIEFVVKESSKYEHLVVHGNLIIGNPKETIQEFLNSIDFVKKLFFLSNFSLDIAKTNLTPFVGTPIRLNPEKYEIDILVEDFEFTRLGMVDIVCKPKSYSISEINDLNALTEKELQSFLNENMFKLPKSVITSKIKLYSKTFNGILASSSWNKTFNRLSSFQKYKKIILKESTVEGDFITKPMCTAISPLRLWDINYDDGKKEYFFVSLNGEDIRINEKQSLLWEKATGKKSILEIFEELRLSCDITLLELLHFYKNLENKFALVFVDL